MEATTIATGGLASAIAPFCDEIDEVDDLLTLTGLRLVWERNRELARRDTINPSPLTEPWELGGVRLPNRLLLAPLAGIGNWFIRMQAGATGPGSRCPRWSRASGSSTRTSARCASSCASTRMSTRSRSSSSATTPR